MLGTMLIIAGAAGRQTAGHNKNGNNDGNGFFHCKTSVYSCFWAQKYKGMLIPKMGMVHPCRRFRQLFSLTFLEMSVS